MFCCCCKPRCCCCCACTCACSPSRPSRPAAASGSGSFVGTVPVSLAPGARVTFPLSAFEASGMGINRAGNALVVKKSGCYALEFTAIFYSPSGNSGHVYIFDGTNRLGFTAWSTALLPRTVTETWSGNVNLTAGTELTLAVEGLVPSDVSLYGGTISAKLVGEGDCA